MEYMVCLSTKFKPKGKGSGILVIESEDYSKAEICGYAVKNGMEPDDTIRTISNNFLSLLEIATFNGWKGEQ